VVFHHVDPEPSPFTDPLGVRIEPGRFDQILTWLCRNYRPVDLDAVLAAAAGGEPLPSRALLVTFDDAHASVREHAAPLCARHGVPALFFVNGGVLDGKALALDNLVAFLAAMNRSVDIEAAARMATEGRTDSADDVDFGDAQEVLSTFVPRLVPEQVERFARELSERAGDRAVSMARESELYLTTGQLSELPRYGVQVANHGLTHARARQLDERHLLAEVDGNKRLLERLTGAPVRAFSVPYGDADDLTPALEARVRDSGHEAIFLVEGLPNTRAPTRDRSGLLRFNRVCLQGAAAPDWFGELEILPRLRRVRKVIRGR